jgi:hypothetical protein
MFNFCKKVVYFLNRFFNYKLVRRKMKMKFFKNIFGISKDTHQEIWFNRVAIYVMFAIIGFMSASLVSKSKEIDTLNKKIDSMDERVNIRIDRVSDNLDIYFNMQGEGK